ncbi:MAG: hypothetical protein CME26_14615 [Gemmatimonadetes bacterium]|nr:hypothetical protein [Gemmatimonadota bacterium]|tara:strand:- start:1862 stop:2053 length:192 start_codon:yes stop_codon:yes gene_type:complete
MKKFRLWLLGKHHLLLGDIAARYEAIDVLPGGHRPTHFVAAVPQDRVLTGVFDIVGQYTSLLS